MAFTLSVHTSDNLALPDYLEYMSGSVDPHNLDAVLESVSALKALANNPMLIVDELNDEFRRAETLTTIKLGTGTRLRHSCWARVLALLCGLMCGSLPQPPRLSEIRRGA